MGLFSQESIEARNKRDASYVRAYNGHYNADDDLLPFYQFPTLDFGDISLYLVSKVPEVAGAGSFVYGIIDKDPAYIGLGISAFAFGFIVDVGVAPIRRMIRGERILKRQNQD